MTAPASGLSGQEAVFSLDGGFRKPLVQRGALTILIGGLAAAASALLGPPMLVVAGLCGLVAAGFAVTYLLQSRFRTVLTPEGIRVRGYFSHFIPWPAVAGFAVRNHGADPSWNDGEGEGGESPAQPIEVYRGSRSATAVLGGNRRTSAPLVSVQVVRTNGHRLTLRAPVVTGWQDDPGFDDKVRLMEAVAAAVRRADGHGALTADAQSAVIAVPAAMCEPTG
jgi:hypothetical protein